MEVDLEKFPWFLICDCDGSRSEVDETRIQGALRCGLE